MFTDLSAWIYLGVTLFLTHITIASVTIYLHRAQAHRAIELNPVTSHFFRFWLWLTTGIVTKEWVAVHRKHHAKVEAEEDPHSPQQFGIKTVLTRGAELYQHEAANQETLNKYGHDAPGDWLENNLYTRHSYLGISIMLLTNCILFGPIGLTIWAIQMIWIPVFAAGVINGMGHWWGYRNFEPSDASTNIIPLGIFIGGEELHNNHHAFASSARFSSKWYELDVGWWYIRMLKFLRLAKVKKLAPVPVIDYQNTAIDLDTIKAVITNRFYVMSHYATSVVKKVYREEKSNYKNARISFSRAQRKLLIRHSNLLDDSARVKLNKLLDENDKLKTVYEFGLRLQSIWQTKHASQESLMQSLCDWCSSAEQTGIQALEDFALTVRAYRLQEAY
ncbi:MAG: acyl-CoA desaturase [Gammaproteobacteria bacterium]|nr:acyl-CoA desaturase [Gammaproteobacteria bacterium]